MEWKQYQYDDSLSTGIRSIDKQHQELLQQITKLMENLSMGYAESVRAILDFLQEYTIEHFGMEEKHMIRYSYPEFHQHRDEHSDYIKAVYDFKCQLKEQGITDQLINDIKFKLGDWFVKHIKHTDQKFGDYLKGVEYTTV